MSFSAVTDFEQALAEWWDAPYAVAVDCCTHALELSLRLLRPKYRITIPANTYVSVPMTLNKMGLNWQFEKLHWGEYYFLKNSPVIDSAVYWERGGYIANSFQCLSFQFKKPLNLGRGGAILCTEYDDYVALKKMSYDGRFGDQPWAEQDIDTMGYHYYMTPETAQMGLDKLPDAVSSRRWGWQDYPDCSEFRVFND
jgi:dTDP-4-amino-4,6-dideoxygalactose transaminase